MRVSQSFDFPLADQIGIKLLREAARRHGCVVKQPQAVRAGYVRLTVTGNLPPVDKVFTEMMLFGYVRPRPSG
jgi:hypothetical protein